MTFTVDRDARTGLHVVVSDDTGAVEEIKRFLEALSLKGLSCHTVEAYAYDLVVVYRWLEKTGKQLEQLRAAELLEFIAAERERGTAPSSINRRLTTCRLLYRFCTGEKLSGGSGAASTSPHYRGQGRDRNLGLHTVRRVSDLPLRVKVPYFLVEPLTADQVLLLLRNLRRYRDLAIVHVMLLCGLRSREVIDLCVDDICFEDFRLRVFGKGAKQRVVPLSDIVIEALRRYLRLERPSQCPDDNLFVVLQGKRRGRAMTPAGLRRVFRHRRVEPQLSNANPHRLRHTFGADMARAGVSLTILQKMMGHANPETTLRYVNLAMTDVASEYCRAMREIERWYDQST
jgi:site-specific recombinase XerD